MNSFLAPNTHATFKDGTATLANTSVSFGNYNTTISSAWALNENGELEHILPAGLSPHMTAPLTHIFNQKKSKIDMKNRLRAKLEARKAGK